MLLALTFERFKRPRQVDKLKTRQTQVVPRLKQRVQDPVQTSEPKLLCSLLQERFLQGCVLKWSGFSGYESNSPNGTLQLSNTNSQVSLPLIPNLSNFGLVEKPWKPRSIINAVIPLEPSSGAVLAYTTRVEATGPLVILFKVDCIHRQRAAYWCKYAPSLMTVQHPSIIHLFSFQTHANDVTAASRFAHSQTSNFFPGDKIW